MRRLCLALFFCGWVALPAVRPAFADANERRARKLYFAARRDMANKRYVEAADKLRRVHKQMGPNIRVLPMFGTALTSSKQFVEALDVVEAYFRLSPASDLVETGEMRSLRSALKVAAAQQRRMYAKARGTNIQPYRLYLQFFPNGPWARNVRARMSRQIRQNAINADDAAFATAQRGNTPDAYRHYLRRYSRGGRHVREAEAKIVELTERNRIQLLERRESHRQSLYAEYERLERLNASEARGHYAWGAVQLLAGLGVIGGGVALMVKRPMGDGPSIATGLLAIPLGATIMVFPRNLKKAKARERQRDFYRRRKRTVTTPIKVGLKIDPRHDQSTYGLTLSGEF